MSNDRQVTMFWIEKNCSNCGHQMYSDGENQLCPNECQEEKINHPKHYNDHPSGIECIDIVEHHDFCVGNAIKYLWRAGLKGEDTEVQDLQKAIWYIERKIKRLERGERE